MYSYKVVPFIYLIVNKTWVLVAFSLFLDSLTNHYTSRYITALWLYILALLFNNYLRETSNMLCLTIKYSYFWVFVVFLSQYQCFPVKDSSVIIFIDVKNTL